MVYVQGADSAVDALYLHVRPHRSRVQRLLPVAQLATALLACLLLRGEYHRQRDGEFLSLMLALRNAGYAKRTRLFDPETFAQAHDTALPNHDKDRDKTIADENEEPTD